MTTPRTGQNRRGKSVPAFLAYTNCETGFRHFTHIEGVDVSFDQKFIDYIIKERGRRTEAVKTHHQRGVAEVQEARKQGVDLPPFVDHIMEQNRLTVAEQVAWQKRLALAEAVLNGELVRDVMFFAAIEDAIAYSRGAT